MNGFNWIECDIKRNGPFFSLCSLSFSRFGLSIPTLLLSLSLPCSHSFHIFYTFTPLLSGYIPRIHHSRKPIFCQSNRKLIPFHPLKNIHTICWFQHKAASYADAVCMCGGKRKNEKKNCVTSSKCKKSNGALKAF